MIYLGNLKKIEQNKYMIGHIHYMPFDEINGLRKTKEELEQEGVLIENIPEPKYIESTQAIMYWNPVDKQVFYEYEDVPKSEEDIEKETLKTLVKQVAEEKLKDIQKDKLITETTKELAKVKLDIIELKKGSVQ
ncbi:hypothetical protein CF098_07700 [Clostridium sporogenes]